MLEAVDAIVDGSVIPSFFPYSPENRTAMKTLKDITGDSLEQMIDYKVIDQDGDSVGTLHSLWSDPTTGAVEFLGVKTGWLFGQNHVVPAEKAELDESQNVVRLPYTSLFVKEAPSISADAEISEDEEEKIYHYYGLGREDNVAGGGLPASTSADLDKLPEAAGASSLASASGQDEGSSNFGAPTSGMAGVSRLRRTVRTETAGTKESPSLATETVGQSPSAGEAVRSALDDLTPGDSSSTSTYSGSAASPGSFGTANLYGSTGTSTPVAADATGSSFDDAATTSTSGATATGSSGGTTTAPDHGANPDPITGEPGSHPVGTGAGALAGGASGVAIGAAIGGPIGAPVGAVIGGIIGAVGGGYAGKGIAESVNPTDENAFWESNHRRAPYYESGYGYGDYSPAYRTGYEGFKRHAESGRDYTDVEGDLESDYAKNRGSSRLEWDKAKPATRDAWDRLKNKFSDATR